MRVLQTTLALLPLTALVTSSPVLRRTDFDSLPPCGKIRKLQEVNNSTDGDLVIPASLAEECLTSVPVDKEYATNLLTELKKYFEFQSTLAWLKNPPPQAIRREPVDLMGGLEGMKEKVERGEYGNNYELDRDIRELLTRTRDGHVSWRSPCLDYTFGFFHGSPIVNLEDEQSGEQKVYCLEDLEGENPSAITKIDDKDVLEWLGHYAETKVGGYHDPDARWNSLFAHHTGTGLVNGTFTESQLVPPALNMTLTFEDGHTKTIQWEAMVKAPFTDIDNGEDYLRERCTAPFTAPDSGPSPPAAPPSQPPGYPKLLNSTSDNSITAYTLPDAGVLAIHTFGPASPSEFQSFITNTLHAFAAANLPKLIIDVSSNDGGFILLGYDAFKQLFPLSEPRATANLRAHPAAEILYTFADALVRNFREHGAPEDEIAEVAANPFYYEGQEHPDGRPFANVSEAYGPHWDGLDWYTTLERWDLEQEQGLGEDQPFEVTNADNREDRETWIPPWKAEDIVLVGNGMCSSTCALFSGAMVEAGVKTAVYGGRETGEEMQFVGGVEGSQVVPFSLLKGLGEMAVENMGEQAEEEGWAEVLPGTVYGEGRVNLRNTFRGGSKVPLEFVYQKADWRVPFTRQMWGDMAELWKKIAGVVWGQKESARKVKREEGEEDAYFPCCPENMKKEDRGPWCCLYW